MGKYEQMLISSRDELAAAQTQYDNAVVKMAGSPRHLRDQVLDAFQTQLDEAKETYRIFSELEGIV